MRAEFDTFAAWTTGAVRVLGHRYAVPGACRGSGTPAALRWLLDAMVVQRGEPLLDIGAGLGGPAAFARRERRVRPVCIDAMGQACSGAQTLFGLEAIQADAARIPFPDNSFRRAWSLGTLCTTTAREEWLAEWSRVLVPGARLGVLVLASTGESFTTNEGNAFPNLDELDRLWHGAGLYPVRQRWTERLPQADRDWREAELRVARRVAYDHGRDPEYAVVQRQEQSLERLVRAGRVSGLLVVAARA
jgi:SAM-dependent methyltransferase